MRAFRGFTLMRTDIRRALHLLILAVLLPVLGLLAYTFVDRLNDAFDDEMLHDLLFARAVAAAFEAHVLDIARQELAAGVALASLESPTSQQANQYLKAAAADYASISNLDWLTPEAAVIASSNPSAGGPDPRSQPWFREVLADPGRPFVVSDLLPGQSSGDVGFTIARGIRDANGKLLGVIAARVDVGRMELRGLPVDLPGQTRIVIFDRQGVLAYRRPEVALTLEQRQWRGKDPNLDEALAGRESSGRLRSPIDGEDIIVARVPVRNIGWVVGAGRPYKEVMRPLYNGLAVNLATMLVIAAVSVLLANLISRQVTRPLGRLRAQAVAIGKGDLDYRTDVHGIVELEELSGVLNWMADSLKKALAEAEARAAENLALAKFPSENPNPVCRVSADAVLIYANEASRPLLDAWGVKVGQHVPQSICQVVSAVMASGRDAELDAEAADRTFSLFIAPVREAGYANLYGRDVTERRKAQAELLRINTELEQRTAELSRSNEDLEQFAYVASHDLQEPLRIVAGYIQLLERRYKGKLDKDAEDFIGFAVDGVQRMQNLIQDLLAYSRVGTRGRRMGPTDCERVLEHALANLRLAIDECGAVITHDPLPVVTGDESQLVQLMQNLIGNAIKFRGERRPEIHISACPYEGHTLFSVKDNGIGIDAPYLERIFVIFQRLHGREKYPGTGIGLALCKRIVERHGGRIWVESKAGEGSIFYFTI